MTVRVPPLCQPTPKAIDLDLKDALDSRFDRKSSASPKGADRALVALTAASVAEGIASDPLVATANLIAKDDNRVKSTHTISILRDAEFLRTVQELNSKRSAPVSASTTVSSTSLIAYALSLTASRTPKAKRRSERRWWEQQRSHTPRVHRVPAKWRDTSDSLRLLYAHKALAESWSSYEMTLRLDAETELLARSQPNPLSWLQKRVDRELTNALKRPVQFYLAAEETDDRYHALHLHGEIGLTPDESDSKRLLVKVRRALRKAGGEWQKARQHQCKIRSYPDDGWASYCAKDFYKVTPRTKQLLELAQSGLRLRFKGPVFSVTRDLRIAAEQLYNRDRDRVLVSRP